MTAILETLLALLAQLAPTLGASTAVQSIIDALVKILPIVLKAAEDLVPHVKQIITILQSNPAALPEQVTQLEALSAQCDAGFDEAAAAAEAEDAERS